MDFIALNIKKSTALWRCTIKSLWTDRVNVQEVKKTVAIATKPGLTRQLANTTSQPQSQKFQSN
ncbi:hypothetical protein CO695_08285 [Providencia alcalifaciens]|nr:hypothetical protein CO695_08285 [Providencia alcalifaciens]EKT64232.1 hypothetical protein OO9_15001 [Providencia alcalifaciens Dmel2]